MRLVVIVGAGASLAEAISFRPKRTRFHPPVDASFFAKAMELEADVARLRRASLAAGLRNPFDEPRPRMEEFFGDAYYELIEASPNSLEAYRALLRSYTRTIVDTTSWFHMRGDGVLSRILRQILLIEDLEQLTFITFNHDLVLENVLIEHRRRQRWCVERGYGPIQLTFGGSNRAVSKMPRHDDEVCDHSIPIEILKLHGSLNWRVTTRGHEPSLKDLFPSKDGKRMICVTDRTPPVTLTRTSKGRAWDLLPQIVPPVYGKQSLIDSRFSDLWSHAGAALREADRLIVIGYSMPVTDVHTEKLLSRSIRSNQLMKDIEVINPDPSSAERFANISQVDRVMWTRRVDSFQG
ncbi:MAG: hypothetical protein ACHP7H_00085 [Hyphomicrobiales bacterium]